jgi:putative solute:sodium symporter small subunit
MSNDRSRLILSRFWRQNLILMAALLVVWAIAGLGCGVLLADYLNSFRLGGFPLGFWFAQQGSIVVFILIILVYAVVMNRLETAHHKELEAAMDLATQGSPQELDPILDDASKAMTEVDMPASESGDEEARAQTESPDQEPPK